MINGGTFHGLCQAELRWLDCWQQAPVAAPWHILRPLGGSAKKRATQKGSIIYTIGILESRIEGSIFWIDPPRALGSEVHMRALGFVDLGSQPASMASESKA